jgi:N-acetylneuraminate synthase
VETERAWKSLGSVKYGPTEAEKKSLIFRRSLFISKDMRAGEVFSEKNIRCVRPGSGLSPKFIDEVIGRKINKDTVKGTPLSWNLIG